MAENHTTERLHRRMPQKDERDFLIRGMTVVVVELFDWYVTRVLHFTFWRKPNNFNARQTPQ